MPEEITPTEKASEVEVETPETVEEKKEKRWLKPLLFLILGIVLAVGLVFTGYKFGQKQVQIGPQPTPGLVATPTPDPTANWKTCSDKDISFKYPSSWNQDPPQILGSRSIVEMRDPNKSYTFNFTKQANYNNATGKPFASIYEYLNMGYNVKTITIDGQVGIQPLPRAGSENVNAVYFFSQDSKFINILELSATTRDETDIKKGQEIFNQILSTFKFLDSGKTLGEKVFCKEPRPEVCTMECILNPPYICGSNGKSYCSVCQACSNSAVEWYVIQDKPCGTE